MVDLPRFRSLLTRLEDRIRELADYGSLNLDVFLADRRSIHAAKYLLVTAIEDALGLANHVIASEGYRAPTDYADAFRVLAEAGLLGQELGERLEAMARFRNLLVHVYGEVDDRRVHGFLLSDLNDMDELRKALLLRFGAPPE